MTTDFYRSIKPALNELADYELFDTLSQIRYYVMDANVNGFESFKKEIGFELNTLISFDWIDFLIVNTIIFSQDYKSINQKRLKDFANRQKLFDKIFPVYQKVFQLNGQDRNWLVYRGFRERLLNKRSCQNVFSLIQKCNTTFGNERIRTHIENVIQMPYKDFLNLGLYLYTYFSIQDACCFSYPKSWFLNIPEGFREKYVTNSNLNRIFNILSCNIIDYKSLLKNEVKYDNENIFNIHSISYNKYPLIEKDSTLYCPIPDKLIMQISEGIYHIADLPSLNKSENNLSTLIGVGFETYIGDLIRLINVRKRFEVEKEIVFGKPERKTSDWIVLDDDSIIFIECKTKRLQIESRSQLEVTENLKKDLNDIAKGIAQLYSVIDFYERNLIDGLQFNAIRDIYPVMVTFQEYGFSSARFKEVINQMVKEYFLSRGINSDSVDKRPFYIYSASEFEVDFQIMEKLGIKEYFKLLSADLINSDYRELFNPKKIFFEEYVKEFGPGSYLHS